MYSHAGRRGPPKTTPSSVLCQKCLKRGHYSYECKVAPQDRPYKSRPSRSQQLRNPKLAPKLHNDTLSALQSKKGVAEEELAKREAERARKHQAEKERDEELEPATQRRRSVSVSGSESDSRSSVSSRSDVPRASASARPPAPLAASAPRQSKRPDSPASRSAASYASEDDERSPPRRSRRSPSADSAGARRRDRSGSRRRPLSPDPHQLKMYSDRMTSSDFFDRAPAGDGRRVEERQRPRRDPRSPQRREESSRSQYRQRDGDSHGYSRRGS